MSENLTISDQGECMLTEFFGTFSVEEGKRCIDAMSAAARDNRRPTALLDCRRTTGDLPVGARFEVAEYATTRRRAISKIALVNREEVVLPDHFVENVAIKRGVNLQISPTSMQRRAGCWPSVQGRASGHFHACGAPRL